VNRARRANGDRPGGHADTTLPLPLAFHLDTAVKPYLVSLAVGLLAGAMYALLRVRSPAPPVIALVGLLGMLAGEQGVGFARALLVPPTATASTVDTPSSHLRGDRHAP
jgi:XapX domain-containing protein